MLDLSTIDVSRWPHWLSPGGEVLLVCADCLEVLPVLPKVDACVTDPPYGIGFRYASHDDTPDGYGQWLWSVIEKAESLCNPGSPVFVWQAMLNCRKWPEWFPRNYRLFAAAKNFVQLRNSAMEHSYDPVIVWWTEGKRYSANNGCRDFHIADTASTVSEKKNIEKGHPCPRPFDQVSYIVDRFTRPNAVVLDCFAGSGTVGVAAAQCGRQAILIEKEPKYFAIARRRCEEALAVAPDSLFRDVLSSGLFE